MLFKGKKWNSTVVQGRRRWRAAAELGVYRDEHGCIRNGGTHDVTTDASALARFPR